MFVISVKRIAEDDYGLVSKNGKILEFESEDKARECAKENIEGVRYISSWYTHIQKPRIV